MRERRLDRYLLQEVIGSGGMAVVWRAHDSLLDREVAVKLMHPHLAAKEESRNRFSREAKAVARLRHPGILEIHDFSGDATEQSYIVTEYIRGRTLRAHGDERGFPLPEIGVLAALALSEALEHAHGQGVIHRDLKPENIMVREDGTLKLMDFGIARMIGKDERMTATGALVGSPLHMAPEVIEGKEAGIPSDIFGLGTILYWMITGRMAFEGNNPTHSLRKILEGEYADPRRLAPACSDEIAQVINRCMLRDPEARYPSAAALRQALEAIVRDLEIEDPKEELAACLTETDHHQALWARLRPLFLQRTRDALVPGKEARALSLLNRLLAADPADPEAQELLAKLRRLRKGRRRMWLLAGATSLLLLAGGFGAWLGSDEGVIEGPASEAPTSRANPPQQAAAAPVAEPSGGQPPLPAERPPSPEAPPAARRQEPAPRQRPAPPPQRTATAPEESAPPAAAATREVQLRWVPQGATLLLNGEKIDTLAPAWSGELAVGVHHVTLTHAGCCQPYEERLEVVPGEAPLRRSIALAPQENGWFTVDCDEGDAEVWLDGTFRGTVAEVNRRGGVAVAFSKDDPGRERYVKTLAFELHPPRRLQGSGVAPLHVEVGVRAGQRTRTGKQRFDRLAAEAGAP